jgi:integrase
LHEGGELKIYNLQTLKGPNGEYKGYKAVWEPGQAGRLSPAAQVGPFYIRKGDGFRRMNAATIEAAKEELAFVEAAAEAKAQGVAVQEATDGGPTLANKIKDFLAEIEANKSWGTYLAYRCSMEDYFAVFCKKRLVSEVDKKDLIAFKNYLKSDDLNLSGRTMYNHFANTMIFLSWAKHETEYKRCDWPDKCERDADAYSYDEIETLLKSADDEDRLVINCFLNTGMRSGEIAHLTYGDVDYKHSIWEVTAKPEWDWKPKTIESLRKVPVADWLTKQIVHRQKAKKAAKTDLIFHQKRSNKPLKNHIIKSVKQAAKTTQKVRYNNELEGRFDDHRFRATFITEQLRNGATVPDCMAWVGHKDPKTILRYAAKVNLQNKEVHRKATSWADRFAPQATSA